MGMEQVPKVTKREVSRSRLEKILHDYESKYNMSSDDFYTKYNRGEMEDRRDFVLWAGYYIMAVRSGLRNLVPA